MSMTRSLGARLRSRDLGTFTWAQLQAAFPNGGAALAALPVGVMAIATDIGKTPCEVTPNAARSRWVPRNGHHLVANYSGLLAAPVNTWSGTTGAWSPPGGAITIPAGVLGDGSKLEVVALLRKRNANATAGFAVNLGTAGTSGDSSFVADTIANVNQRDYYVKALMSFASSSTACMTTNWLTDAAQNTSPFLDRTANMNTAAAMIASLHITSINASDFVDLVSYKLAWMDQ